MISIIIPVLNEAESIQPCLRQLEAWRAAGHEVIVIDGGSTDNTQQLAQPLTNLVLESKPGRAAQMNTGAQAATGELLWFLHVDSSICVQMKSQLEQLQDRVWGRFDVTIKHPAFIFRVIENMMNWRSRATGIATGDQGIFVSRKMFEAINGYADIALMEDIVLSKMLKRIQPPKCLKTRLGTSARRWLKHGVFKTMLKMWWLRLTFFLGASPNWLSKQYW